MEPASCISQLDEYLLFILIIAFILDWAIAAVKTVYQIVRDFDLFAGVETNTEENSAALLLNNESDLVEILGLALNIQNSVVSAFSIAFASKTFCLNLSPFYILAIAIGIVLLVQLLECLVGGIFSHNVKNQAVKMVPLCKFILKIFKPFYNLFSKFHEEPKIFDQNMQNMDEVEDQLRDWVENVPDNSSFEKEERKMIHSILNFSNTLAREVMIPRVDMIALDVNSTLNEAAEIVLESGHSRLPVFEEDIDNITGILYAKDLLKAYTEKQNITIKDLLRPALFVPESKKAGDLLNEMQNSGIHIVVVVDEYGGTAGIVSMEDLMEEIVGEIRDEYDETEEDLVKTVDTDKYSFLGRIDLSDVNEYLDTHLECENADTLAGFMYSEIGKVPVGNETVEKEGWLFSIEELSGRRIRRILAEKIIPPDKDDKETNPEKSQPSEDSEK